jgi:Holliday junction resolvasome RuvABC endonuclease subunit
MTERILSLDVSTKTGWSLLLSEGQDFVLEAYGKIEQLSEPKDWSYPISYVLWAKMCFIEIRSIIEKFTPDVLVIEETASGSKSAYSQKILEWIHFLLADFIKDSNIKAIYVLTEQWRRETGCLMSKEESKHNKEVKKYKEANETSIAYDSNGKRVGKITRKHVNIRRANEVFSKFLKEPLRKKDEDTADSLLLGYCYHLRRKAQCQT